MFTLDNTKDATHFGVAGPLSVPYFYKGIDDCGYLYLGDGIFDNEWCHNPGNPVSPTLIKLSRQRKEDFLIPISYVKKFTPLVVGDGWANSRQTGTVKNHDVDFFNSCKSDGLFITSFADRPNTGSQPVGDDVVVDRVLDSDDDHEANSQTCKAGGEWCNDWSIADDNCSIKTWKPNHAAMLKQYQAEQQSEHAVQSHHIALQIEVLGPVGSPVEIVESETEYLLNGGANQHRLSESIAQIAENTSETHDVSVSDNGVKFSPKPSKELIDLLHKEVSFDGIDELVKPIDTRTDEEKAIDDLNEWLGTGDIVDAQNLFNEIKAGNISGINWTWP